MDRLAQGFSVLLLHAHLPQLLMSSSPTLLSSKLTIPFIDGVRHGGVDLPSMVVSSLIEIGDYPCVGTCCAQWSVSMRRNWLPATI
jgi:hypothetical protein